jgi:hypothetical protein
MYNERLTVRCVDLCGTFRVRFTPWGPSTLCRCHGNPVPKRKCFDNVGRPWGEETACFRSDVNAGAHDSSGSSVRAAAGHNWSPVRGEATMISYAWCTDPNCPHCPQVSACGTDSTLTMWLSVV